MGGKEKDLVLPGPALKKKGKVYASQRVGSHTETKKRSTRLKALALGPQHVGSSLKGKSFVRGERAGDKDLYSSAQERTQENPPGESQ